MKKILILLALMVLAACTAGPARRGTTHDQMLSELTKAVESKPVTQEAINNALLPPLKIEMPKADRRLAETRFDLVVNNAPANQVFLGIVSGTRYSMLVHPDVTGNISVNLKDVTLFEALDALREQYGYEYKIDNTRIFIQPSAMQTRVFQVNYLTGQRRGTSDIRVTSGSVSDTNSTGIGNNSSTLPLPGSNTGSVSRSIESSRISTTSNNDFWVELAASLKTIIGVEGGRSVVVSPQSGVVVVRGMPADLRNVAAYLRATQLSVERQVILEAKILEVELNDGYQAGINWAGIANHKNRSLALGRSSGGFTAGSGANTGLTIDTQNSLLDGVSGNPLLSASNGIFGIAFASQNFAALLEFLQTQGNVQVLSSPRIATLNNQKAVLKVGTDDFFVTNVSSNTTASTGATTTTPTVTLQPFFSGIALDVTPQIDANNNIILHIHPSVSLVTESNRVINLGSAGTLQLPLASSNVSETDSIVRAQNGQVVAIGGLMRERMTEDRSQVPALGDVPFLGSLFRQTNQIAIKRELVILLKPTIVEGSDGWNKDLLEAQDRVRNYDRGFSYGGRSDVFGVDAETR